MMLLESWHSDLVQRLTQPQDPGTVALTGEPPLILVLAALAALPVSIALLWRYRRAVLRSMRTHVSSRTVEPLPVETSPSPNRPAQRTPDLPIVDHTSPTTAGPEATVLYSSLLRIPWRAAALYAVAGSCYALVMATATLMADNIELRPLRYLITFWTYAWPVVLTVNLVAAATWRAKLATTIVYFFVLVTLGAIAKIPPLEQDQITIPWWGQIVVLWLSINLPATGLLWVFLNRRIRAVGPLVLTFMILAFTGLRIPLSHVVVRQATEVEAYSVLIGLIVLGIAVFGLAGWLTLRWIGARYERKKISDQSVTLDSIWLLFGFVQSIPLFFGGAAWILSGLVAFAAYKVVALASFSLLGHQTPTESTPKLLLLRVFALGKRSERLFEAFAKHWRHIGSIQFIAGPDLATTTIEPHEFLDFLSGRLARRFIDGPQTLELRIS